MKKSKNWAAADASPLPSPPQELATGRESQMVCQCAPVSRVLVPFAKHSTKGQNTFLVIANTAAFHTPLKYQ